MQLTQILGQTLFDTQQYSIAEFRFNKEFQQTFTTTSPESFLCIDFLQQNEDASIEIIGSDEP